MANAVEMARDAIGLKGIVHEDEEKALLPKMDGGIYHWLILILQNTDAK